MPSKAAQRAYYERNREEVKARCKARYEANRASEIARGTARKGTAEAKQTRREAYRASHPVVQRVHGRTPAEVREQHRRHKRDARERRRARLGDRRKDRPTLSAEERAARSRANVARWRREYPEKARRLRRMAESARRARQRDAFVEHVDPEVVYAMHGGRCGICCEFIVGDFHVDHRVALAHNGMHCYANTQPAHPRCNLAKGAN